ncbi:hypothetical protein BBR01nite_06580 [Brevibacillus brevis]|nr:hypothetical protein BBR01nite_06580 [Brevibacillus brevis]
MKSRAAVKPSYSFLFRVDHNQDPFGLIELEYIVGSLGPLVLIFSRRFAAEAFFMQKS